MDATNFQKRASCYVCGHLLARKFPKQFQSPYQLFACPKCLLWQIYPIPDLSETKKLYEGTYFEKRTDRGYNQYDSESIKKSVISTLQKNLADLHFTKSFPKGNSYKVLEIGCAAGHVLEYFSKLGWQAEGIDIAPQMVEVAKQKGFHVQLGDFLEVRYNEQSFDLIMLWATIEHLPNPRAFLAKASRLIKPNGHIYLSTCHTGFFARLYGHRWRYLNVPEHIFYFHLKNLNLLASQCNLVINKAFTYGSGFTSKKNASLFYTIMKKVADKLAKIDSLGDMIVCDLVKK